MCGAACASPFFSEPDREMLKYSLSSDFLGGSDRVSDVDRGVEVGIGLGSTAIGIKKLSPSPGMASPLGTMTEEFLLFR